MRKIERLMNVAITSGKDWKLANTEVTHNDGVASVFLHNNLIAEIGDNFIRLFDGGWQSNTTKSRLNAICNFFGFEGEGVFQKDFVWYIRKLVGMAGQSKVFNAIPFVNGYTFA